MDLKNMIVYSMLRKQIRSYITISSILNLVSVTPALWIWVFCEKIYSSDLEWHAVMTSCIQWHVGQTFITETNMTAITVTSRQDFITYHINLHVRIASQ